MRKFFLVFLVILKLENWPEYFLDFFGIVETESIVYRVRNGLKYLVRTGTADRGIVNAVVLEDEYRIGKINFPTAATIIDIGGQNGYFSIFTSQSAARIFVYEPVTDNFRTILENIKLNDLAGKIKPFNLAVASRKEPVKIFLDRENTGGHSVFGQGDRFITAQTTTIPEIFSANGIERCDLLKIDIEGGEYDLLYNLPDEYFERIAVIRMECHEIDQAKNNRLSLVNFLRSKGYTVDYRKEIVFATRS
jgi:FkbM family methyltransferase